MDALGLEFASGIRWRARHQAGSARGRAVIAYVLGGLGAGAAAYYFSPRARSFVAGLVARVSRVSAPAASPAPSGSGPAPRRGFGRPRIADEGGAPPPKGSPAPSTFTFTGSGPKGPQ